MIRRAETLGDYFATLDFDKEEVALAAATSTRQKRRNLNKPSLFLFKAGIIKKCGNKVKVFIAESEV